MVLKVKALYDCSADDASELSFKKGDIIVDVTKTNEEGWLEGRKEGSNIKGLFPSNYVQLVEEKKIPPKIPPRKIGTNSNNNIQEIDKSLLFETGSSESIKDPESDIGISIGKPRKISKNTLAIFESNSNETLPIKPSINPRSKLSPSLDHPISYSRPPLPSRKISNTPSISSVSSNSNDSPAPQTPPRPFSSTNSSTRLTKSVVENHTDNPEKAKITTQDQSVKVAQQGRSNTFSQLKGEFEKSPYSNKKIPAIKSSQSPPPLPSRKNLGLSTDSEIKIPHRPPQYSGIPPDAKKRYELVFDSNKEEDDLIDAAVVREIYIRSRLNNKTLYKIWDLLDTDKDGYLNRDEFCIGMFLIDKRLEGNPVPDKLPKELLA